MKRFMVLAIGLAFLCSSVAFAADEAKKEKGKKGAPAVSEPAAAAAPAEKKDEKKDEKKAEKKAEKKSAKKKDKKDDAAPAAK